jgi:hypothetical protein
VKTKEIPVPSDSLLANFGGQQDYRDCFVRELPSEVTLPQFLERFYRSPAFRPEALILSLLGRNALAESARRLAQGEQDRFGVWRVVQRQEQEILLESKSTGTASWFAVEPTDQGTRLYFGSWVGNLDQSGWRSMQKAHVFYSHLLLGSAF